MKSIAYPISIILFLIAFSCAKQTSPTGGPKDTIPPILVKANPAKGSINFKGKSMELEFSETIITNNPKEQIIITPTLGKAFDVKAKKKKVRNGSNCGVSQIGHFFYKIHYLPRYTVSIEISEGETPLIREA